MRIGIAYDLAPGELPPGAPDDLYEEFDKPSTIDAIAAVLRDEGHSVQRLGNGPALVRALVDDPPDFVWNLAEGQGVGRSREARVPALLELLNIPYSGSDPFALAVSLDKSATKCLVEGGGVIAPGGLCVPAALDRREIDTLLGVGLSPSDFPVIVKPALEGSSKGIRGKSIAFTIEAAAQLAFDLARTYIQPILVEPFIAGDEVTVGLVGNGPDLQVLGAMRVVPNVDDPLFVYSLDVKRDWRRMVRYEAPAVLADDVRERLFAASRAVFERLGCRDLARVDFRVRDGVPYFLEINPLPGLAPETSDLILLAEGHGLSHADLIRSILKAALSRLPL